MQEQSDSFNSVGIVGADGVILAASRNFRGFLGARVDSPGSRAALQARQALISPPYVSIAGNLLITLSHPIYSRDGRYRGYIAGSIHLRNESALQELLGRHHYQDGSYLYVVDRDGKLIYHVDPSRLGEDVSHNPVVAAVKQGESGARRLLNTKDVDMLAGYAVVTSSGWGIIAQRPTAVTLEPIQELIWALLGYAAPLAIAFLLAIWWCARMIRAARAAGDNVEHHDVAVAMQRVRSVKAWYFEAERLKHAVIWSFTSLQEKIGKLNLASITDPHRPAQPARHAGRRRANARLGHPLWRDRAGHRPLQERQRYAWPFDRRRGDPAHGADHARMLAPRRRAVPQRRRGIPDAAAGAGLKEAGLVAERLRKRVEARPMPGIGGITVSAGVACWQDFGAEPAQAFAEADAALYAAAGGRNRVVLQGQA